MCTGIPGKTVRFCSHRSASSSSPLLLYFAIWFHPFRRSLLHLFHFVRSPLLLLLFPLLSLHIMCLCTYDVIGCMCNDTVFICTCVFTRIIMLYGAASKSMAYYIDISYVCMCACIQLVVQFVCYMNGIVHFHERNVKLQYQ